MFRPLLPFWLVLPLAACGGEEAPPRPKPSAEQVRDYYGLNSGSCWRYKYQRAGATLFTDATLSGPNATSIAGRTVYVRAVRQQSSTSVDEWFLDAEKDAEIRLVRSTFGNGAGRTTSRYENSSPLFARLEFDRTQQVALNVGDRFESDVVPSVCVGSSDCADGPAERHEWAVLKADEMVMTADGPLTGYLLEYRIITDTERKTARYTLVPGRGFLRFTDFDGTFYDLCAYRACDSAGACVGAMSCNDLACP